MADGFVLDTNVVVELERPVPDPAVMTWFTARAADELHLTATVVGELWYGVELKPEGARRTALAVWLAGLLDGGFEGCILPFDAAAARIWGRLMAEGRRAGRPPSIRDAEIAAVALAHGLTVATHNVRGFEAFGVAWMDPWRAGPAAQA